MSYKVGMTEPTTEYLRNIQKTETDISFVLFGISTPEPVTEASDWMALHQAARR